MVEVNPQFSTNPGENPLQKIIRPDIPGRFNEVTMVESQYNRIKELNKGIIVPPYEIIIHPSAFCNLQCQWCIGGRVLEEKDNMEGRLPSRLTNPDSMAKVIQDVVDYEVNGFKVDNVSFSGITGEPLVAKKALARAVDILRANDRRTGIFSNSVLIDPEIIDTLLKMNYINISLDAATPETFARMKFSGNSRGIEVFNRLDQNIKDLVEARNRTGSQLEIGASFILYPDNYKEIAQAARHLKDIGVGTLRMKQDISGKHLLTPEQKAEAAELLDEVDSLVDDSFRFVKIHPIAMERPQRHFTQCRITDLWAAIGSDGNLYPCNYNAHVEGIPYGNAIETPFKDIWEGEKRKEIRSQLPAVCPANCDPYKGRANNLLHAINELNQEVGPEQTDTYVHEIFDQIHD